jgi:hypothetical protein
MLRRSGVFVVGACCGAVVARRWRPLVKRAVVAGVVGGSMVKTGAARMAENLSDVTHEALTEVQANGANGGARSPSPSMNGGSSAEAQTAAMPSS